MHVGRDWMAHGPDHMKCVCGTVDIWKSEAQPSQSAAAAMLWRSLHTLHRLSVSGCTASDTLAPLS
jgi:hypothetical protein